MTAGLEKLATLAKERNASVHMPRIGCGLAGGTWEEIEPIIQRTSCAAEIDVFVYDLGSWPPYIAGVPGLKFPCRLEK